MGCLFSPQKYTQVKTLEKTKSPVKLQHYKMSSSNDIVNEIQFEMSNIITANNLSNIGSLMSVSANQLITLQAEVTHISQVKDMPTINHGELKKQDVMIRDPTGTTKLVLWEKYVDEKYENLEVRSFNNGRYLNTPKDEQFNATEIEPFQQDCQNLSKSSKHHPFPEE